jgi:hypothetical protein
VAGGTIEPIAVGFGHTSAGAYHGARWNGITITDLGALAGGNNTEAYGCSATGARVCGGGYEGGTNNYRWAIYWDDSGTLHQLPTLPDAATEFGEYKGEAWGMSRDGSTIYGIVDIEDDVPAGETLTDSELLFQPQHGFVDLSVAATRQLFVSLSGTPQWMGVSGEIPFAQQPAVYLTTLGPPLDFPQNNGNGGAFVVSGEIDPAAGPGCTPHIITEATGPAQRPQWRLTVSDDGARTWSTLVKPRDIGALGHYKTRLRWLKMGQFRQRVIKLECTDPVRRNVIGIYIDIDQGMAS